MHEILWGKKFEGIFCWLKVADDGKYTIKVTWMDQTSSKVQCFQV